MDKYRWLYIILPVLLLSVVQGYSQNNGNVEEITIRAITGLQFDKVRFRVQPETKVKIIFENTDDIDHNMLITKPETRKDVVEAALNMGDEGGEKDYIPTTPDVLWSTPVLSPGESYSIRFTTPEEEGVYPFVCTFAGHGNIMYGAMYVSTNPMPPIKEDPNIPIQRIDNEQQKKILRPYGIEDPPYLYRTSMPASGPASIAVNLSDSISYNWDPDKNRLMYAWHGGFVDNTVRWSTKGDAVAKVLGTIFYQEREKFPLKFRGSESDVNIEYSGYRLIEGGYPEFHYTIDGKDIYELIKPVEEGVGIQRRYTIPHPTQQVIFTYTPQENISVEANKGNWNDNSLTLEPDEAKEFIITMKNKDI